ncbi:MAG: helix-turn-helix transcriptional regulator [Lachnospiraceae bacterium]|nr:helix-turn-helix transcriptional regulator [Lachnospiraceae bacterium]
MIPNKFYSRLSDLRIQRNFSARDLSLSLGQSAGYINKIENKKSVPSMLMFFAICEQLNISPKEYFDDEVENPGLLQEAVEELKRLKPEQLRHLLAVMKDLNASNTPKKSKKT